MRGKIYQAVALVIYGVVLLTLLAAVPHQGIPPSPAIYTGTATVNGEPAPEGTELVACVDNQVCAPDHDDPKFRQDSDRVGVSGRFSVLIAQGVSESQRGRATVHFFLINDHGRIKAQETTTYGSTNSTDLIFSQNLTFGEAPTPEPTPTPATPTPTPTPATPEPTPTPATPTPPRHPQTPSAPPTPETGATNPWRASGAPVGQRRALRRHRAADRRVRWAGLRPPSLVLSRVEGPVLSPVQEPDQLTPTNQPTTKKGRAHQARPFTYPHDRHPLTPHTPTPYHKHRAGRGPTPQGHPCLSYSSPPRSPSACPERNGME